MQGCSQPGIHSAPEENLQALHEERNTENKQQRGAFALELLMLQNVALGRTEMLGWCPSSHQRFLLPRSEPAQCGWQGRNRPTEPQNSCGKPKHSAPIRLARSYSSISEQVHLEVLSHWELSHRSVKTQELRNLRCAHTGTQTLLFVCVHT